MNQTSIIIRRDVLSISYGSSSSDTQQQKTKDDN